MRAYVCLPGGVLSTSSHMHSCVHSTRHAARTGRGDRAGVRGLQDSDCNAATAAARSPARMAYGAQRSVLCPSSGCAGAAADGMRCDAMRCDGVGWDGMGWAKGAVGRTGAGSLREKLDTNKDGHVSLSEKLNAIPVMSK